MRAGFARAVRCSEMHGEIMKVSRSKPPVARFLACVPLLAFASSCTTWRSQSGKTQSIIEAEQPTRMRVNRTDGSRLVLENPTIVGDRAIVAAKSACGAIGGGRRHPRYLRRSSSLPAPIPGNFASGGPVRRVICPLTGYQERS